MKIRPSLRLYFLAMMIITGVTAISIMSVISFNYFITGIDFSMGNTMRLQAFRKPVSDGNPIIVNDFFVASRWEDLPKLIKTNLKQQDLVDNELLKNIQGNLLFGAPKTGYFAMKVQKNDQVRYVSSMFGPERKDNIKNRKPPPITYLGLIALAVMAIFSLVPFFILRKVAQPIERLTAWTKKLDKKQLSQSIPDFHYSELNSLAAIVQASLKSVQESLDREQQFLGYASHELRTPIAVMRTNTELLRKMIAKNISTEKQLQVLDRLERASFNMTDLTETLLWLNRKPDKSIPLKTVSIGLLTQQLLEELTYLLNGKNVEVIIKIDPSTDQLPEALCRIVISNLIRNALQHTTEGKISITQSENSLTINNQELAEREIKNELGFGLGLELTERLVAHYDWHYKNESTANGHYVEINFS